MERYDRYSIYVKKKPTIIKSEFQVRNTVKCNNSRRFLIFFFDKISETDEFKIMLPNKGQYKQCM